ncbi:MAG TPA: putative aminohydrolase SsnA [Anaerolineae bacterium]|nr:putative aminohydrolase SsnA [Anaerolineae bacterium]
MLIVNGLILTFGSTPRVIPNGALRIEGPKITAVSTTAEMRRLYPGEQELNAGGRVVMPGLICAHTHFYGLFSRGMALGGEPAESFSQILERLWWRLDKALHRDDVKYSALYCLVDAIRSGTTTLLDHHASPYAIPGSLDAIAEAVTEGGVRACLCYEVSDRDGPKRMKEGLEENARFIRRAGGENGLLAGTFGLHASLTLSDDTLAQAAAIGHELGAGFHIHVAEAAADQEQCLADHGMRVVERLTRRGILGPKTIAAHCVHVNAHELGLLRETGTRVVHNPRSNMNNAVGAADVPAMLAQGIEVGLGNDGFSNNMFSEIKTAFLLHKHAQADPRVLGADQTLEMATRNNARTAGLFFPEALAELTPGASADIIFLDYDPPTPLTVGNLPWHLVFGMDGAQVSTTIVAGKILMHNRQLQTLDEQRIAARARELAVQLWERV